MKMKIMKMIDTGWVAGSFGHRGVCFVLVFEHSANTDLRNKRGETALDVALANGER